MSQKLNSSILEQLKCPRCMNYMMKPILSCTRGHSICSTCGPSVNSCPICQDQISLNYRNYTLEAISELLKYPRSYSDSACRDYIKFNSLNDHRHVGSYPQPEKEVSVGENITYIRNTKCLSYEKNLIRIGEEVFVLHCKSSESHIYWAMQHIGKPKNKNNFHYTLKIVYDKNRDLNKKFIKRCCNDLKTIDKMIAEGLCISIPTKTLKFYENKDSNISYTITINKI